MLWLKATTTTTSSKHPSTMYWKFGNKNKSFTWYSKEAKEKVSFDPIGTEHTVVWIGWCFSWFYPTTNKPIYSTEVPYNELSTRWMQVYTYNWDDRVVLFDWVYDKNTTKSILKDKGASLYLNLHVVVWEGAEAHIETLQFKGLNVWSLMEALKKGDYDNYKLKFKSSSTEKYKVISYEKIEYEEGSKISESEKADATALMEELSEYYETHNTKGEDKKEEEVELPF